MYRLFFAMLVLSTASLWADKVTISTPTNNIVALNRKLFGVNTTFEGRPFGPAHSEVIRLSQAISLPLIRYPGGTLANFLDWRTASLVPETAVVGKFSGRAYANYAKIFSPKGGRTESVEDIVSFAKAVGGAEVSWVINVLTGDPSWSAEWVKNNKEKGFPNTYWELGNEYYLKENIKYPTAEIYLADAKLHAIAMRAIDPKIKIGVVAATFRIVRNSLNETGNEWVAGNNEGVKWNDAIGKESKFFDGVIAHEYSLPGKCWLETQESVHASFMARNAVEYPRMIRYYRTLCGNDVKLWLTEWNITPTVYYPELEKAGYKKEDFLICKTLTHALYVADELLQMIRFQENIEMAHLHDLVAPFNWGLFQMQWPENEHMKDPFVTNLSWHVFQTFALATAGCSKMAAIDISNAPMMKGGMEFSKATFPSLVAAAFYDKDRVRSIVILNKSMTAQNASVDKPIVSATAFTADEPLENWGKSKLPATSQLDWQPKSRIEKCEVSDYTVTLPKTSLTLIQFR